MFSVSHQEGPLQSQRLLGVSRLEVEGQLVDAAETLLEGRLLQAGEVRLNHRLRSVRGLVDELTYVGEESSILGRCERVELAVGPEQSRDGLRGA